MIIINATPHNVNLILGDSQITFEKSDIAPRVNQSSQNVEPLSYNGLDIPVKKTTMGNLEGLPPETEGVYYIVSLIVLEAGKKIGRNDLLAPDTIRDASGNIIGCKGFIQ
jgi:hypothetical protein